MTRRIFPDNHQLVSPDNANPRKHQSIQDAQELIYNFLIDMVNNYSPEEALMTLKHLFIFYNNAIDSDVINSLYTIILNKDEQGFRNTLKRACYIMINNWAINRQYKYIQELIKLLAEAAGTKQTLSRPLNRLKNWLSSFVNSKDYQELKLFASPYTTQKTGYWSHRYTSYLLVPQYLDSNNPIEQREIARNLSKQLKEKFKLELAMYTARCASPNYQEERSPNPTRVGTKLVDLIKQVIPKHIAFNYKNYAHIFIEQINNLNYKNFKISLLTYIIFHINDPTCLTTIKTQLTENLANLYKEHHQETLTIDLLLRTCRRVINLLTTEDGQKPSSLFILLASQGNPLNLVVALLKIILICQYVRTHLECCIAQLIRYYEDYPEEECQWFIDFLEVFNLVLTIYTDNVQYNLVKVKNVEANNQTVVDLDAYRIFPQLKGADLRGIDFSGADISGANLSAADLRGADLSNADLRQANLSLAKLTSANLSSTQLNGAELSVADLSSAELRDANLSGANLCHTQLRQANLSGTNLVASKLNDADLQQANLSKANLSYANAHGSDLSSSNLYQSNLQHTDLSESNLSDANLCNANLCGADLHCAKLHNANLSYANLHHANLCHANLKGANLTKAHLNFIEMVQVNLQGAKLNGSFLRCGILKEANLSYASLCGAELTHAELNHANLTGANLSNAILRHVNFSGADLSNANLCGAHLFMTNLNLAQVKGALFQKNSGLSEQMKLQLEQQGAIFKN